MGKPRILIMAGGTGGHVFPALAVAQVLKQQGWEVYWLGTKAGLESKIIPQYAIPLYDISVSGLRRRGLFAWCAASVQLWVALYQALRIVLKLKPQVALGMGGFVSGPGGLAAWLLSCPLIIHEQNAVVGLTNRWLARIATKTLEAFPGSFKSSVKAICTGNPVREALLHLPWPRERFKGRQGKLRVLILGGSRGAEALNQLIPEALCCLPKEKRPEIWHQTGEGREVTTQQAYEKAGMTVRVEPFIEDMVKAYAWADLAVCRAGALTVTELTVVGVASILIPFPFAVDNHQMHNGRFLEAAGAAKLMAQSTVTPEKLADIFLEYSSENGREALYKMAEAAYTIARRDALKKLVTYCKELKYHAS